MTAEKKSFDSLLIPIGGGDAWELAVNRGLELAKRLEARIELLVVIDSLLFTNSEYSAAPGQIEDHLRKQAKDTLQSVAGRVQEHGLDVNQTTEVGDPASEIIKYADQSGAGMIIMATKGSRSLAEVLIGSVTDKVVRTASMPVLSLRVNS